MKNRKNMLLFGGVVLLACALVTFSILTPAAAQRGRGGSGTKTIKLTTGDLSRAYEIVGIVSYKTGSTSVDDVNKGLIKAAGKMGGVQYIISVRYFSHAGSIYGYGTAVKPR